VAAPQNDQSESSPKPSPWAFAMAVLAMLALGVGIGAATDQVAGNASFPAILLEPPPPAKAAVAEAPTGGGELESGAGGGEAAPLTTAPSAVPPEVPLVEKPLAEEPGPEAAPIEEELPTGLPEIKHVFVIVLGEAGFEETFGKTSTSKLLAQELPAQGELLSNYFAVTDGGLANEIALVSGQGPTPETAADCPSYTDVLPGTESVAGQVEGNGCVYPATTATLPGQLADAGLEWKAYIEGSEGDAASAEPTNCRTWRNPFAYFHSITEGSECAAAGTGLPQLAADLKLKADQFPALAYVSLDPATTEESLKTVVPEIKESIAYKDGGLLAITFAQARHDGENPDTSGCCIDPAYPNLPAPASPAPATGPVRETGGGGRVGLLLLSPFVEPGTTSETYFNHFSLLATIEELFGLERIGYAAEPAITGFDESIFNAGS
jgi:phosphatidylinositol-3-phosphatase